MSYPTLTNEQKAALAFETMTAALDLLAARHERGDLGDHLAGVPWETITRQLALWFERFPGNMWDGRMPRPGSVEWLSAGGDL